MKTVFIEATNGWQNWGKFMVARFDEEYQRRSEVVAKDVVPAYEQAMKNIGVTAEEAKQFAETRIHSLGLLNGIGWNPSDIIVFDLQTREGAAFKPGGCARADLDKHKIWVCPLFEPFLEWLYQQDLSDLNKLPKHVDLPDAEFHMYGYRRSGSK